MFKYTNNNTSSSKLNFKSPKTIIFYVGKPRPFSVLTEPEFHHLNQFHSLVQTTILLSHVYAAQQQKVNSIKNTSNRTTKNLPSNKCTAPRYTHQNLHHLNLSRVSPDKFQELYKQSVPNQ